PSAAPRWKIQTSVLFRLPAVGSAAKTARRRKAGPSTGSMPTEAMATPPFLRKSLRVTFIVFSLSAPLEFGRAQHQGGDAPGSCNGCGGSLGVIDIGDLLQQCRTCGRRDIAVEQMVRQDIDGLCRLLLLSQDLC